MPKPRPDTTRCDICQRDLPADEVQRIGDTAVCEDCQDVWCKPKGEETE